jgi:serine phosphatase RsbU (regulator of sigma subunit)
MKKSISELEKVLNKFKEELNNFEEIASYLKPSSGDIPELKGVDIYGESIPLNSYVGGDHIIYLDFKKRYDLDKRIEEAYKQGKYVLAENLKLSKKKTGILLADVAGHKLTDAALASMLHQAFLVGVLYELDNNGSVTTKLFENINTRFYMSSGISKYITMIYGEVWESGIFKFISAAHPFPVIYSAKHKKISEVCLQKVITFPPIGTMPSKDDIDCNIHPSPLGKKEGYVVNELKLIEKGDILLVFTDGFSEHQNDRQEKYFDKHLKNTLSKNNDKTAKEIFEAVKKEMLSFAKPQDDISYIIIKKI